MKEEIKNPQAFPRNTLGLNNDGLIESSRNNMGMTLRDYFAAHSDISIRDVIDLLTLNAEDPVTISHRKILEFRSYLRYMEAALMLKERAKK